MPELPGNRLIDHVGRKPLLLAGAIAMAGCLVRTGQILSSGGGTTELFWWLLAFNASFGISQGAVIWVYLSEVFPPAIRAKGLSFGNILMWTVNGLVSFLFALVEGRHRAVMFYFFALSMILQFGVVLTFYPETKRLGAVRLHEEMNSGR